MLRKSEILRTVTPTAVDRHQVRIDAQPGSVRIDAPELFSGADDTTIHRLVERLLRVDAVEAIHVDHAAREVALNYDHRRLCHAAALTHIAAALRDDHPQRNEIDFDLDQIAGRVVRVERRRRFGGVMTTIISTGAGLIAAVAPRFGKRLSRESSPNGGTHSPLTVHRNGLSIDFFPSAIGSEREELRAPIEADLLVTAVEPVELNRRGGQTIIMATGWRRAANLAAAGGCFFLSFVGLVTPGIPTVPFVLATSYFLVRSSPALDERLRRSKLFGQMVRDWTTYGGMRPSTKRSVVIITLVIMGGTLLLVDPSAPILILMTCMGTLGTALILSTPTVPQDAPDDVSRLAPE